jgi:hypothetical protein
MAACPLLEPREDSLDALLVERIRSDPTRVLEDDRVTVFEHVNYYGQQEEDQPDIVI